MQMTILINENQKKILIKESLISDFSDIIKKNYEFTKEILKESKTQMGVNLEFLVTWGASIGGFVGPLTQFIEGKYPELTNSQITSIAIGITATFYLDNKETIKKILNKIKEDGLSEVFLTAYKKAEELKTTFLDFIDSLNLTLSKVTNMMTYTFIIPVIEKILYFVHEQGPTNDDIKQLILRMSSFGLLTVSSIVLSKIIKKMVQRFRENP